jgi:hypothetical protein
MTTATISVTNTLSDIAAAVERVKNDELQRFPEAASVGDAVRQGDIYIQKIDDADVEKLAHLYRKLDAAELSANLQLAPGDTKGSRHVLASTDGLEMWVPVQTNLAVAQHVYAMRGRKAPNADLPEWKLDYSRERREIAAAIMLAGPVFKCNQPNTVAHPEHGDWALPPGTYRVIFQRTVDEAERVRRVLD